MNKRGPTVPPGHPQQLTSIDLFAGCGGLSLGLETAGFKTLLFSELNKDAAATYRANRHDSELIQYGDIYELSDQKISAHLKTWSGAGVPEVDLVAGGPPCQGYSKIGHRRSFTVARQDIPSNRLFREMIRVIRRVQPKIFLFENVAGLLTSRWTPSGEKGEIFRDVIAEFLKIEGYAVRWELVHARDYGVPQNRPRVLIVGIRENLGICVPAAVPDPKTIILASAVSDGLLPAPVEGSYPHLEEILGDLDDPNFAYGGVSHSYHSGWKYPIQRELRRRPDGTIAQKGDAVTDHEFSAHSERIRAKFRHMLDTGEIPAHMRTKKFAQRVLPRRWNGFGPNITATSLPDDFVHYCRARTLSVREWARLQTFPDWYSFKGPRTTGGWRRAGNPHADIWDRDVPKYTQIGNAVPVSLAHAVGLHLAKLIHRLT